MAKTTKNYPNNQHCS